jgi:hypothetical protein
MPLFDYLPGDEEDQQSEIERFLSRRWSNVMDKDPVLEAMKAGQSSGWFLKEYSVRDHKVVGQDHIEVRFSFKATGYDENQRQTDEVLVGTAKAWIDEYDNLEFSDVEAEITESGG